jgi:hypothetical protein
MHKIILAALLSTSIILPSNAAVTGGLNEKCQLQPIRGEQTEWQIRRRYQFRARGQSYTLVFSAAQDGSGSLCLSHGNTFRPIATPYWDVAYIDRVDRVQESIFTFQIHQGNGDNVPVKKYRLDLSNPRQPKIKLIKQWIE